MANQNKSSRSPRRPAPAAPVAAPTPAAQVAASTPPEAPAAAPAAAPAPVAQAAAEAPAVVVPAAPAAPDAPSLADVTRRQQAAEQLAATAAPDLAKAVELTAAEAAAAVKRLVPVLDAAGKPTGETEPVALQESEVQAWAVRGQRVIVVTIDGQKLEGKL